MVIRAFARSLASLGLAATALSNRVEGQVAAQRPPLPRVHILATGGTISNMGNQAARRTGQELVAGIQQANDAARVTVEQFSNVASGAVTDSMWRALALRIRELQDGPDTPAGFVVTHGTDTMEETAFFLSLTVGGCAPVVVTGAMRQANAVGADGPANLLNSVRVAAAPVSRGRGTVVLMNDEIFAARDVTKSNTTRLNAFTAPDAGVLGVTDPGEVVYHRPAPAVSSSCQRPLFDIAKLGSFPRVDVIYAHVGADSILIDAAVAAGAKALVVAGVGRGGTTPAQSRALRRARDAGLLIVSSNRTGSGRTGGGGPPDSIATATPGPGANVSAGDLNPQKARVLVMLALAAGRTAREIGLLIDTR